MRRPRDVEKYVPALRAAAGLREIADQVERSAGSNLLVKCTVDLHNWNPEWEKKPTTGQPIVISMRLS